jgi:hypothetical protein
MSRRRTLLRSLTAFCARIRLRHTAELASLVLYLGEDSARRERMLDAALQAIATVPGERVAGSPAASQPQARAITRRSAKPDAIRGFALAEQQVLFDSPSRLASPT